MVDILRGGETSRKETTWKTLVKEKWLAVVNAAMNLGFL
jgi:hypothetical protein